MNTRLLPIRVSQVQNSSDLIPEVPPRYLRFGPFDFDLQRHELFRAGSRVKLPGKVCEVLLILVEKPGDVVTRETLRARLWPPDSNVNYDANVNTTVNKLRQVLGDSPDQPVFVETIPRRGYTFIAKVEYLSRPAARIASSGEAAAGSFPEHLPLGVRPLLVWVRRSPWFAAGIIALLIAAAMAGAVAAFFAFRA